MKQLINIGSAVDVGDGDYLRKGGEKINANFNDIYYELGDEERLFSAGAWKIIDESDCENGIYNIKFGQSIIVDTRPKSVKIHLPEGGKENVGKVIKLRDVYGSWVNFPVEIKPFSGDTIKGKTGYTTLDRNYLSIELVYTANNRWEYVETTQIDKHISSDLRSVITNEVIAFEGQTDFPNPFGPERYNPNGLEVYRRGNRLYYGDTFSDSSEYGSIGENGELVPLDGETIKLRDECNDGDTIAFTSYIDGIETFRTSYNKRTFRIINKDHDFIREVNDSDIVIEDSDYSEGSIRFSLSQFGIQSYDHFNPYSVEVYLNGVKLVKVGEVGVTKYFCYGADQDYESPLACQINGGEWIPDARDVDYNFIFDGSKVLGLEFNFEFESQDILSITWFNNVIGATLSIDDIRTEMDQSFLNSYDEFHLSNQIKIGDVDNIEGVPTQDRVEYIDDDVLFRPTGVKDILELVYPIGHIYTNLYNKESPEKTLGFGKWRRLEGQVLAGFSDDYSDTYYGQNHNFLDAEGNPTPLPGNTFGKMTTYLEAGQIPQLEGNTKVLTRDPDGEVNIGACMVDPGEEGDVERKYSDTILGVNMEGGQDGIDLSQPTIVVSMWVRVG